MDSIEMDRVDKLNELIERMEVINYLNELINDDIVNHFRKGLSATEQATYFFISKNYNDIAADMREYVNSDSFIQTLAGNCY